MQKDDVIYRQDAIDAAIDAVDDWDGGWSPSRADMIEKAIKNLPSVQPDYSELKQEFFRMASYIDVLLECSDEQKETLNGFISRLSEYMPWAERD